MTAVVRKPDTDPSPPRMRQHAGGGGGRSDAQTTAHLDAPAASKVAKAGGGEDMRERRDIVSGGIMPEHRLIRFVAAPDGNVVPDVAAKLPGRGLWVEARRAAIDIAVAKKLFARAAKAPGGGAAKGMMIKAEADLADRAEKALLARMAGDLGMARRSGALTLGFDNVLRALDSARPPSLLIEASDGAGDGKRKLFNAAHARGLKPAVVEGLTSAELGLALGRVNVIHAAVQGGGLAERLTLDAERLSGLRNERDS
jgi:predicted RNA-binding protein YlxR (DUF448 family)